jgi:hypothetical protein
MLEVDGELSDTERFELAKPSEVMRHWPDYAQTVDDLVRNEAGVGTATRPCSLGRGATVPRDLASGVERPRPVARMKQGSSAAPDPDG